MNGRSRLVTGAVVSGALVATMALAAPAAAGAQQKDALTARELEERKSWTAEERQAHGEKQLDEFEDVARITSVSDDPGDDPVDDAADALPWSPGKVSWPEPAEAGLEVADTARRADVGGLPVSVKSSGRSEGRAKQSSKGSTKAADHETRKIQVEVLRQDEARARGIEGVLLRVSDASATTGATTGASPEASRGRAADGQAKQVAPVRGVDLSVDYSTIADAFGGGWSDRLRLVEIPECQLTGADDAGTSTTGDCEPAKPLASTNDPESQTLSATLAEPSSTMLAMTADESGSSGDWSATSLSPSASWDVSTNTGNFSWSYPMRVPPAPAGPEPELALGYSSGSLDGRVASTNNQSSWIGDGWDMSPGFIERRYVPCLDDRKDVDGKSANNASHPSGDLCWDSDNATMTFDGSAVELVKDASTGNWLPKHDDATRVQHLTGGQNADNNGEYWKVTTADGTQYFFGRGQRSASDSTKLNSAWTVPVFGNHAGEPCHASSFGSSSCTQAWRWNLDYVVDTSGNTMTYTYGTETNRYGRNNDASSVQYVRGGWLKNITYGQRKGAEASSKAPVRVDFSVSERCLKTSTQSCSSLTDSTASAWPDVPADLICTSSSSCADVTAPVFFTRKRLTTVTTKVFDSGSYRAVDAWTLQHTFPDPGDSEDPVLWLDKITHSGKAGGTTTLPAVDFDGEQMANRVDESGTFMPMNRLRLTEIRSESGALTTLTYSPQDCTVSDLPADPATNTRRCFPVRWTPEGATEPVTEYFHKYLVTGIAEDPRGSDPEQVVTTYEYVGGAAWRYDDDPLVAKKDRTWGQFRGYATVDVTEGETGSSTPGRTRFRYFRGMDGDRNGSGGTRSVAVDGVTDHDEFAGMLREEITYNGTGSSVVEKVTSTPWRSGVQATDADGRKSYQAAIQTVVTTTTAPKLAGGERETYVKNYFDSHGQVYKVLDLGDRDKTGDELCTNRYRVSNTSKNIIGAVKREEVLSVGCWGDISRPADVVSDERYSFDGQSFGATPTRGLVTRTEQAKKYSSGSPVYVATERTVYDSLGRATSVTDALGRTSTTAYTPASGGPVTKVTSTTPDPDGSGSASPHTTVTELDPAWGAPETVTDPNGKVTTATYDALGRITKVWKPGRAQGEETPHLQYTYTVRSNGHNAVTTKTLDANNNYRTSVSIYDGLLRDRQTQVPGANRDIGGRVVSDTKYDSRGLVAYTYDTWATTGDPSTYAVLPSEAVPTRTRFVRDGAGRVTAEVFEVNEDERWRTTTTYLGDRTVVDPPTGGTPTSTITDARGRTTTLRQFTGSAPTGDHQDTTYSYDQDGNLAEVTDAAGNEWTYTYDMRGRLVEASDPDKGTTTSSFDDAGQVLTTTDARGKTLAYTYDDLGRTTERRSGSVSGALLAEWTYDTVAKGQVSSSTRYSGGDAYTTSVTGYDDAYHVSGQTVTLPESEGELAGSYTSRFYYTDSGAYRGTAYSDLGNLLAENLVAYYDDAGMPLKLASGGGDGVYVGTTRYTSQGQVEAMDLGTTRSYVVSNHWDEGTRRLMKVSLDQEGVSGTDLAASFSYDAAGNVLKVDNRPTADGAPARDTQCFDYDGLRRLTSVWTPAGGSCATAKSVSGLGGPARYWTDYAYDPVGNRTSTTEHTASGNRSASYTYPAAGGARPHAVSKVTEGSQVSSYSYDAAGNTTTRDVAGQAAQNLIWDAEGELSKVTQSGESDASFVYTADGDRLIRRQDGVTTVYLPGGQELTLTAGGTTKATRYYSWAGQTVAVRTGTTFDEVSTLVSDHQGTASMSITNVSAQISRRYQTPFGKSRGAVPSAWSGDHGFLDKPADATGLTAVGARYYDPTLGRFVSVDPVMDLTDPQQWHGYAYGNNNPVTWSDPTGKRPEAGNGFRDTAAQKKASVRHMARNWTPPKPKPPVTVPREARGEQAIDIAYEQLSQWTSTDESQAFARVGNANPELLNDQIRHGMYALEGNPWHAFWAAFNSMGYEGGQVDMMLLEMEKKFRDQGPWDAKVELAARLNVHDAESAWLDLGNGYEVDYDIFGNVQYGAMMRSYAITLENAILATRGPTSGNPDTADDAAVALGHGLPGNFPNGMSRDDFKAVFYSSATRRDLVGAGKMRPKE